ncbi:MAG TPA: DUF1440 domain-containing protein [Anaerolineaceae bacterium]|nr:DUF1440 domain-containing protein [Anaerolineaceae bacterium]
MQRLLPKAKQEQLPPEEITMELSRRIGVNEHIDKKPERAIATWISHFGYGAGIGSLYPLLARRVSAPVYVKGMLFGLIVWAGSYLGWVPAANVLPPATEHSWQRNTLMISAHLLWGSLIGLFVALAEDQE